MNALERHPIDIARAAIGFVMVVALGALVHWSGLTDFERDVFQLVNDLPGWVGPPVIAIMQLGTLTAVAIAVVAALVFRKWWLALALTVGVGGAWLAAQYVKEIVNRGRPGDFLTDVIVRGSRVEGYGYPSAHCTVAAALVTIASPYLPRAMRRAGWGAVFVVAFARMYVGAHFPIDVIGGIALGWSIGALTNLAIGTPCHELADRAVQRALVLAHYNATELARVPDDGHDEVPFVATIGDGPAVFVKALDGERRHADALATAGRYLAYRHVEDEHMFATARERIEHEALAASLAGGPRARRLA